MHRFHPDLRSRSKHRRWSWCVAPLTLALLLAPEIAPAAGLDGVTGRRIAKVANRRAGPNDAQRIGRPLALSALRRELGPLPFVRLTPHLEVDGGNRQAFPAGARLRRISSISSWKTGSSVYSVNGGHDGYLKVFPDAEGAVKEIAATRLITDAKLPSVRAPELAAVGLLKQGRGKGTRTVLWMRPAPGKTVKAMLLAAARAAPRDRDRAMRELEHGLSRAAIGLARLHGAKKGAPLARKDRYTDDVQYSEASWRQARRSLPTPLARRIDAKLRPLWQAYLDHTSPATFAHGDANLGNLFVAGQRLTLIDNDKGLRSSWRGRVFQSPAVDIGRLLEDLHIEGATFGLARDALNRLEAHFLRQYRQMLKPSGAILDPVALRYFRVNYDLLKLKYRRDGTDPKMSERRLLENLGLSRR